MTGNSLFIESNNPADQKNDHLSKNQSDTNNPKRQKPSLGELNLTCTCTVLYCTVLVWSTSCLLTWRGWVDYRYCSQPPGDVLVSLLESSPVHFYICQRRKPSRKKVLCFLHLEIQSNPFQRIWSVYLISLYFAWSCHNHCGLTGFVQY